MSKFNSIKNNFSNGEVSPKVLGRLDLQEYDNACELMNNFIPLRNGGATKRPGTRFVAEINDMFDPALLPFVVSEELGYTIAIDPTLADAGKLIRIFKANGDEMVVNQAPYDLIDGVYSNIPTDLDPRKYVFAQLADGLFVTHTSGRQIPFVITRLSETTFVVNGFSFPNPYNNASVSEILKAPYRDTNITGINLTPSATVGTMTVTASAPLFNIDMVGGLWKITHGATTGVFRIDAFLTDTTVTATVSQTPLPSGLGGTTATTNWEEAAWSDHRGWPKTVTLFEQSLYWGGNDSEPDRLWKSLSGNVFHMMAKKFIQDAAGDVSKLNYFGDLVNTDPTALPIGANKVNRIAWMKSMGNLNVGTLSTEYIATGNQSILGPLNGNVKAQTQYGGRATKVEAVGNEVIFVSLDGRKLRSFKFSDNNGSNISVDLNLLADHISRVGGSQYGFEDMSFQQSRDCIWLINKNDKLLSFSYQLDARVIAWAHHDIANEEKITGIASIPNFDGISEDLFCVVRRTIDGATKFYIETIVNDFDAESLNNTPVVEEDLPIFLDSGAPRLITNPAGDDTLTTLDHLEGEEVTVTKDGFVLDNFTVVGGEIDLGQIYPFGTRFIVGYKYTAEIHTVSVDAGGDFGSSEGAIKRIDRVYTKLFKTFDLQVGAVGSNVLEPVPFTDDIFTGDKRVNYTANPDIKQAVRLVSEEPYPCTILSLSMRGVTYD